MLARERRPYGRGANTIWPVARRAGRRLVKSRCFAAAGFDRDTVKKVERLVYLSEYKRFQSAPGARRAPPAGGNGAMRRLSHR